MLPESFMKSGTELAKDARIFGIRFDELSRDELMAVAAMGWKKESDTREEAENRTKLLTRFRKN